MVLYDFIYQQNKNKNKWGVWSFVCCHKFNILSYFALAFFEFGLLLYRKLYHSSIAFVKMVELFWSFKSQLHRFRFLHSARYDFQSFQSTSLTNHLEHCFLSYLELLRNRVCLRLGDAQVHLSCWDLSLPGLNLLLWRKFFLRTDFFITARCFLRYLFLDI